MTNTGPDRCGRPCSLAGAAAGRSKTEPSRADFTRGMQAYLEQRGDLCVGRPSWPIDVPDRGGAVGAPDATSSCPSSSGSAW